MLCKPGSLFNSCSNKSYSVSQALHKVQVLEAEYEQLKSKVEQEIANKTGNKSSQKQLNKLIVDLTEVKIGSCGVNKSSVKTLCALVVKKKYQHQLKVYKNL